MRRSTVARALLQPSRRGCTTSNHARPDVTECHSALLAFGATWKEAEVGVRISWYYTEEEIAAELKISVSAVKKRARRLSVRIDTHGRAELATRIRQLSRAYRDANADRGPSRQGRAVGPDTDDRSDDRVVRAERP